MIPEVEIETAIPEKVLNITATNWKHLKIALAADLEEVSIPNQDIDETLDQINVKTSNTIKKIPLPQDILDTIARKNNIRQH